MVGPRTPPAPAERVYQPLSASGQPNARRVIWFGVPPEFARILPGSPVARRAARRPPGTRTAVEGLPEHGRAPLSDTLQILSAAEHAPDARRSRRRFRRRRPGTAHRRAGRGFLTHRGRTRPNRTPHRDGRRRGSRDGIAPRREPTIGPRRRGLTFGEERPRRGPASSRRRRPTVVRAETGAVAGELGLEPRMTVPKTVVLPLHHSPAGPARSRPAAGRRSDTTRPPATQAGFFALAKVSGGGPEDYFRRGVFRACGPPTPSL